MSDPRREWERRSSPFWGVGLVFALVMIGLIAYGYYGAHTKPGSATSATDVTEGRSPEQSPKPAGQP
jgi:hypothetical protein